MHTGEVTIVERSITRVSLKFSAVNTTQFIQQIEVKIVAKLIVRLCSAFSPAYFLRTISTNATYQGQSSCTNLEALQAYRRDTRIAMRSVVLAGTSGTVRKVVYAWTDGPFPPVCPVISALL